MRLSHLCSTQEQSKERYESHEIRDMFLQLRVDDSNLPLGAIRSPFLSSSVHFLVSRMALEKSGSSLRLL